MGVFPAENSKKGIILPELKTNGYHALGNESLTDESVINEQPELFIYAGHDNMISPLTHIDSSIGVTRPALVNNQGTIMNKDKPIWRRKPRSITKEEYAAFYKSLTNDLEEHLAVKHFSIEDQKLEFKAILFVPNRAPFNTREKPNNIKFLHGDLIKTNYEKLTPEYLCFVKGIVDSKDLPRNISREMWQQNNILKAVSENLVKKCIELFFEIAENKEDYNKFYEAFSENLKAGIHEDSKNKDKIAELLRYHSSASGDEMTSLKDYVTRMKEGQNDIYYIIGESKKAAENSPFLEKFKKGGYEVLFMVDPIDEDNVRELKEYEGKKFVAATKEGLKLDDESESEEAREDFDGLCYVLKDFLGDKVDDVVVCYGFVHSPFSIVTLYEWTTKKSRKILKIHPENPITHGLRNLADADRDDKSVKELVHLLYDNAHFTSLCEERAWKLIKHN